MNKEERRARHNAQVLLECGLREPTPEEVKVAEFYELLRYMTSKKEDEYD